MAHGGWNFLHNTPLFVRFLEAGTYKFEIESKQRVDTGFGVCKKATKTIIAGPQTVGNITGPNSLQCNRSGTVTYSIPANPKATITWSADINLGLNPGPQPHSPSQLFTYSPSNVPSASGKVYCTVNDCGITTTREFMVYRTAAPSYISGNQCIQYGNSNDFFAPEGSNFNWSTVPQGAFSILNGTTNGIATISANNPSASGAVMLTYNRPCDNALVSINLGIYTSSFCSGGFALEEDSLSTDSSFTVSHTMEVFPNPATDQFTVVHTGESQMHQVKLFNSYSKLVKEFSTAEKSFAIQTNDLPTGFYYLITSNKEGVISRKRILIKR